ARHTEERIAVFEPLVSQRKHHRIRFKYVKSLWGSCTTTGNLTFNLRLVHYPPEIIDYVVIHELSHLTHHNHSKVFWNLVRTHYPEVTEARRILKESRFG
ncbi:MAG: M48 family metallopeptidase, partial [Patescibacteria group bacterium]